jgi:hypothetical protein
MIIARVEVGLGNTNIKYNSSEELGTAVTRGTLLTDGAVVRGIGTHFASQADKDRYDTLTTQQLKVRIALAEHFVRVHFFKSAFIINAVGDAKKFVADFVRDNQIDPSVLIDVAEFQLEEVNGGVSDKQLSDWGVTVKEQLERVRMGHKRGQVNSEALTALETLADCPALSTETAGALRKLVGEFRLGNIRKDDFQRSISILDVKMNRDVLVDGPRRSVPQI